MPAELTSRQRGFLRSAGRRRRCDVTVGKAGLGASVLRHVRTVLGQKELIKVRLLGPAGADRFAAARSLAEGAEAVMVDLIGKSVVLYKPNDRLPPERRIQLPGP